MLPAESKMATAVAIGGAWRPYKELLSIVEKAVYRKRPEVFHELDVALKKYKPDFLSLLKNPSKNANHRQQIKEAPTKGISLQGQSEKHKLPEQFVQEVLIISDILDLNEYMSVDLLLAGEQQQPNFPGLTRGLVSILLYHDGRRSLVSALRTLIQSREGVTWTLGLSEDLQQLVASYTDSLRDEGLTTTILQQLEGLNLQNELDKLQKGQGIGDSRHKQQLIDFITDQRQLLAECLFCFACQSPLPKSDCLQMLSYLKQCQVAEADGKLDSVTVAILFAVLACFSTEPLEKAAELQTSFDEDSLPLLSDQSFIPELHQEIVNTAGWENSGLCSVIQLAWSLALRSCSQWPNLIGAAEILEEDEAVLDMAIDGNVFHFLRLYVIRTAKFHQEEFFVRQMHSLVTGFIVKMPLKVKELRNQGDEVARILRDHLQEGLEPPPDLARHFEDFMKLISDLYEEDPLGLELATEFWCPPDPVARPFSPMNRQSPAYRQQTSQKQVSLYKFVRLAGDLLPTSLFVPYLGMLTGLSSSPQGAHQCFNLLKSSTNSTLSWDHFFTSIKQYYMEMRQIGGHTVSVFGSGLSHTYRPHTPSKGITTEELEGLQAVLRLTERVAEQDETARIAMCESQSWLPIASLFGLLGCPIPASLKAHLLGTLAAFASSPEIASSMWHTLELSQVLQTVGVSGQASQEGGILVELNEIEARNEAYPETRGFLKLLSSLTDNLVPPSLGAGYRAPGFEPYLQFIRDSVFLKFQSRSYRDPNEKWQVASSALEVLFKLLEGYTPLPEHFVDQYIDLQGGERTLVPRPPGHTLMVHMLNDTPMLRMILSIIDSASELLQQLSPLSEEKEDLEKTALLCLRMIEVALEKQAEFLNVLRSVMQSSSLMVTPLDQLLLSINPQTHAADYLLKITRFLTHMHTGAELSLSVVKILCHVCHSVSVQSRIVGLLTTNTVESLQLLIGFVDHLDINEVEDMLEKDLQEIGQDYIDVKSYSSTQIRNATRQNIMRLMLHSLEYPGPNLAHFLLGFELRKPASTTNLQDPGVLGAPKTCLHAILDILNKGVDTHHGPVCVTETPKFTELTYQLIYHLCANKDTCMPTLRYLRTSHNFLYRHLQHLPFKALTSAQTEDRASQLQHMSVTNQQSWLLKAAAIELKVTALGRQRSHTQRLLALLFNEPSVAATLNRNQITSLVSRSDDFVSSSKAEESSLFTADFSMGQTNIQRKILNILETVEFKQAYPPPLQLNYFDATVTERVISSCEQKSEESGVTYGNVHMLHRLLMNEINGVQGAATAGQKSFLIQEVREILQNVVQRNMVRESLYVKKESFEAWRQVVEVVLATCPTDIFPADSRQAVIAEINQDLLVRVADEQALPELTAPVSGVILTLMTHLCQSTLSSESLDQTTSILYGPTKGHLLTFSGGTQPTGALFAILRGLIDAVLRSGGGMQRVRANLYATLLYYMRMFQRTDSTRTQGVLGALSSHPGESMDAGTLSILSSYGEQIMETVCRDACDGHDVGRMLAFSLLDAIIDIDWQQRWLMFLNLKGYLRHMVESLVKDDESLQAMLDPSPEPLRALYIYESKMALLARIAQSTEGAKVLLQSGLMSRLAECQFLDQRPEREQSIASMTTGFHSYDVITSVSRDSFVPTVMERYRQLLIPALKVTLAVLSSLGPQHQEAATQVLHFVLSHSEVFISILQDRALVHNLASLQELALVTGIVCNAGLTETSILSSEAVMADQLRLKGPLARVQRLMFDLMPRYCSSRGWDKITKALVEEVFSEADLETLNKRNSLVAMEATMKLHQICSNVIGYCRLVISASGPVAPYCHVVFSPSITELTSRETHRGREGVSHSTAVSNRPQGLGVLVSIIKDCAEQIVKAIDTHNQTSAKLQNLRELSSEEMRELSSVQGSRHPQEKLSTQQRHILAQKCLTRIVDFKDKEIASQFYIIENALFILWRHLDFYYVHCVPSDDERSGLSQAGHASARVRRLQEYSSTPSSSGSPYGAHETLAVGEVVTRADIQTLKRETAACLTETLLKRIAELEQQHGAGRTRIGFVQALVRRVRRLLTLHGTQR